MTDTSDIKLTSFTNTPDDPTLPESAMSTVHPVTAQDTDGGSYSNGAFVAENGSSKDKIIHIHDSLPQVSFTEQNGKNHSVNGFADHKDGKMANGGADKPLRTNGEASKEKTSEKKEKKEKQEAVSMMGLFRFADRLDVFLMLIGTVCACAHGSALPIMIIVFGSMTDSFVNDAKQMAPSGPPAGCYTGNYTSVAMNITNDNTTSDPSQTVDVTDSIKNASIYYAIIGAVVLLVAYVQVAAWLTTSHRQSHRIRLALLSAVLRQEIGWFDTHDSGEMSTRLSDDVNKIQEGIGDKIGNFFQWFATFICGIIIGLVKGWKLALVIFAVSPLLVICGGFMTFMITSTTKKELTAYAKAGSVAEEVLSAFRTVVAFGGQLKECDRYTENLHAAKAFGIRKGMVSGLGLGLTFFVIFGSYALAFWYGGKLVREEPENYTIGVMLIVFFCVIIGAFALGNAAPNLQNVGAARGAAFVIWNLVDRKSEIDSSSEEGLKPETMVGNVEFKNIMFHYPSRPDIPILNGLTCKISRGQTVALVGSSGCGKSTVVQLLQRFYDPLSGDVELDGINIKKLNIKWLRQRIGVVSQEPILFAMTIAENIRYGREEVTQQEIEQATKEANAYDFICKLPQKFETMVGERGAQLSGGQKQRIAIARALVRDPKILLLDEATSALDTESEAIVQAALDKVRQGRTTIVVAHRLSTIKTADIIYGIKQGVVHEHGTHDELMQQQGIYHTLVTNQKMIEDEENELGIELEASKSQLVRSTSNGGHRDSLRRQASSLSADKVVEEKEEKLPDPSMGRIMALNKPEWYIIVIGCVAALVQGGIQPAFAIIFSTILGVFAKDCETQQREILLYSMMFLVIGAVAAISMFLQAFMFSVSGEFLTMRVRQITFKALLRQEVSYFDDHKNTTGALTTRLATDASAIQGATGSRLGVMCQSLASIGTGIIIGFVYGWQLTLFILAFMPLILIAGIAQMKLAKGFSAKGNEHLEDAGKVATEAIVNIRTVASLTREPRFIGEYKKIIDIPQSQNLKKAHIFGITFSFTQSLIFFAYAAIFMFGAFLISKGIINYENMFKVFSAIIFGAMAVGQASQFAPDYGKAKSAAARIFKLWDNKPSIDSYSDAGVRPQLCSGTVEFREVHFRYPTRPTVAVLRGLNLKVAQGQTIALVGSSGCGKSTTVQLLERFYDPENGQILVDNNESTSLNVSWLRSQIGLVSQEPILFDRSIGENIAYGDNSRTPTMDEIIQAAREANIHNFIDSLPQGYDTNVGDKGAQLSGGQKQRVAIARALLRNPKILLLDEATSALDTESEKIVQEALDRAQQGRTCIVIAHRLSTIQNADCIVVFHNGQVAELGTHSELLAHKGLYYKLNLAQAHKH